MSLFIRLYLDEDVDVLIARLLRSHGFEATTTLEENLRGQTDKEQLAFATKCDMCLFTHNRDDFVRLAQDYLTSDAHHFGIVIATPRPPHEVVRRLLLILNRVTADEIRDHVRYV